MENSGNGQVNRTYFYMILLLMLVLPVLSVWINVYLDESFVVIYLKVPLIIKLGKWFVFWAIGVRLFTAGLRQVTKPKFTLEMIFNIKSVESSAIVRELGFANICFGLSGILSIFIPDWRPAAAFTGGLYMGIAGVYHIIKKPSGFNEIVAMVSDLFVFIILAIYLIVIVLNNNILK